MAFTFSNTYVPRVNYEQYPQAFPLVGSNIFSPIGGNFPTYIGTSIYSNMPWGKQFNPNDATFLSGLFSKSSSQTPPIGEAAANPLIEDDVRSKIQWTKGAKSPINGVGAALGIVKQVGEDIMDFSRMSDSTELKNYQNQLRGLNNAIWNSDFGSQDDIRQAFNFYNPSLANYTRKERTVGQDLGQIGKDALSGAAIGTNFMPGIGTAIGAAAGAVWGGIKDIYGHVQANKQNDAALAAENKAQLGFNNAIRYGVNMANTKGKLYQDFNYSDMGGPISHGTLWPDNVILVDNGGTHEANPYGGVLMGMDEQGTPNLVEEGEVIWNDYVFSNRLKVPQNMRNKYNLKKNGGPLSFADAVKSSKQFKVLEEMPNDAIAKRTFESFISDLAMSQEELRQQDAMKQQSNRFDWGGPFYEGNDWAGFINWIKAFGDMQRNGNLSNTYRINNGKLSDADFLGKNFKTRQELEANERYKKFTEDIKNALKGDDPIRKQLALEYINAYNASVPEGSRGRLVKEDGTPVNNFDEAYDIIRGRILGSGHLSGDFDAMVDAYKQAMAQPETPAQFTPQSDLGINIDAPVFKAKEAAAPDVVRPQDVEKSKNNWAGLTALRYAPIFGNAIAWMDNVANPIDYSNIERYENYAMGIPMANTHPIGNYTEYRPFDINYAANRLNAQGRNTELLISDLSSGNSASARGNLIASMYGARNNEGDLLLSAWDSNLKQRQFGDTYNRETNKYNSEDARATQLANTDIWKTKLGALMQGAAAREALDTRYSAAQSANKTAFFDNLGNLGREEFIFNQLKDNPAIMYDYYRDALGRRTGNIAYRSGSKGGLLTVKKSGRK